MKKITYLIGAGASCGALPIVKDISKELHELHSYVKKGIVKGTMEGSANVIADDLLWLASETHKSLSIDTYAKRLYLQRDSENLKKLKTLLSFFFINRQAAILPDKRYDGFFASILNDSIDTIPNNIKIVSWNYDSQFELAYKEYSKLNTLESNQKKLRIHTKFLNIQANRDEFGIFKLNGTAAFLDNNSTIVDHYFGKTSASDLNFISQQYLEIKENERISSAISFAWEEDNKHSSNVINAARQCIGDTQILVIIGYSFPNFNRKIDSELINTMSQLEKIYIQDLNTKAIESTLLSIQPRFGSQISRVRIKQLFETSSFYIPQEFIQQ